MRRETYPGSPSALVLAVLLLGPPAVCAGSYALWRRLRPDGARQARRHRSRAAQEAIAISYWRTYEVPLIITNCMNLIGETQDPEKFVPMTIQRVRN